MTQHPGAALLLILLRLSSRGLTYTLYCRLQNAHCTRCCAVGRSTIPPKCMPTSCLAILTLCCRYESTHDGFIDRDEFAAGLARLGLSFSAASLALDDAQQAQLLEVLFKDTTAAGGTSSDRVPHAVFDANLGAVSSLDFMADSWMLLDAWCYNSRCARWARGTAVSVLLYRTLKVFKLHLSVELIAVFAIEVCQLC